MIYADLHIHIGQSLDGKAVKITASSNLTLPNIIDTGKNIKGLSLMGVIDAQSPGVTYDFKTLIKEDALIPCSGGGYRTPDNLLILPGTEIELKVGEGQAHLLAYFPSIEHIQTYVNKLKPYVKNWQLSSQKAYVTFPQWLEAVEMGEGIWFPAHAFTPHKGIYGNCCRRLEDVLPVLPKALEIGLSADSSMAGRISELDGVTLFSNSDAHSLPNIGREYNVLRLDDLSFQGFSHLVHSVSGAVLGNYGLPPQIGKYHRTYCLVCERVIEEPSPQVECPHCHTRNVIMGVLDRLDQIADRQKTEGSRPPYVYQVPLEKLPGIGPKMYAKLLQAFGTEMAILHETGLADIEKIGGEKISRMIEKNRSGTLAFSQGGGGFYGKVC